MFANFSAVRLTIIAVLLNMATGLASNATANTAKPMQGNTLAAQLMPLFKAQIISQLGDEALDVRFELKESDWNHIKSISETERQSLMMRFPENTASRANPAASNLSLRLDYLSENLDRRIPISTISNFEILSELLVTQEVLPAGMELASASIGTEKKWLNYGSWAKSLHNFDALNDKIVKRTLNKGSLIQSSDLEKMILVHSRQDVFIIYEQNNLVVKSQGVALTQGGTGDLIKVQNPQTKKILTGKILNREQVKINF